MKIPLQPEVMYESARPGVVGNGRMSRLYLLGPRCCGLKPPRANEFSFRVITDQPSVALRLLPASRTERAGAKRPSAVSSTGAGVRSGLRSHACATGSRLRPPRPCRTSHQSLDKIRIISFPYI